LEGERAILYERLARLKQKGRVEEYMQEFEILVVQVPKMEENN